MGRKIRSSLTPKAPYRPLYLAQPERSGEPAGDEIANRVLAPDIEMIAIGRDFDIARPTGAVAEAFGRIVFRVFLVAADEQRRAPYLRRQFEHVGHLGQAVEKTLGANHVPPARHQHQSAAATRRD